MHAIGMGGVVGLFLMIAQSNTMLMTWPLSVGLLLTGLVGTSRLLLRSHQPKDIYMGFFAGVLTQFAAGLVLLN